MYPWDTSAASSSLQHNHALSGQYRSKYFCADLSPLATAFSRYLTPFSTSALQPMPLHSILRSLFEFLLLFQIQAFYAIFTCSRMRSANRVNSSKLLTSSRSFLAHQILASVIRKHLAPLCFWGAERSIVFSSCPVSRSLFYIFHSILLSSYDH